MNGMNGMIGSDPDWYAEADVRNLLAREIQETQWFTAAVLGPALGITESGIRTAALENRPLARSYGILVKSRPCVPKDGLPGTYKVMYKLTWPGAKGPEASNQVALIGDPPATPRSGPQKPAPLRDEAIESVIDDLMIIRDLRPDARSTKARLMRKAITQLSTVLSRTESKLNQAQEGLH